MDEDIRTSAVCVSFYGSGRKYASPHALIARNFYEFLLYELVLDIAAKDWGKIRAEINWDLH